LIIYKLTFTYQFTKNYIIIDAPCQDIFVKESQNEKNRKNQKIFQKTIDKCAEVWYNLSAIKKNSPFSPCRKGAQALIISSCSGIGGSMILCGTEFLRVIFNFRR